MDVEHMTLEPLTMCTKRQSAGGELKQKGQNFTMLQEMVCMCILYVYIIHTECIM